MFKALRPASETADEPKIAIRDLTFSRVASLVFVALILHGIWAAEFVAFETQMEPFRFGVITITLTLFPFATQAFREFRSTHRPATIAAWLLLGVSCIPLVLAACVVLIFAGVVAGIIPARM